MSHEPEAAGTQYSVLSTQYGNELPDSSVLAEEARSWNSVYVHIPFCARRCPYCDFAVVAADEAGGPDIERYVDALIAEIGMELDPSEVHAVNFGGGTPTQLRPGDLARIIDALDAQFGIADGAEISIEANPEDWTLAFGRDLRRIGFNRVSFGIQSFDPVVLEALGRVHTPRDAREAFTAARSADFSNINIDLIYGAPEETDESWRRSVERAIDLEPDHLSAYALTVEGGTALSRAVLAGAPAPDPDEQADRYEHLDEAALSAGLVRYELSNWARPGQSCRYNLSTWMMGEFSAFGTGAHDHRNGVRARNIRRLDAYLHQVEEGVRPRSGSECLDEFESERERFTVGLRLAAGVQPGAIGGPFMASDGGRRLVDAGVVGVRDGRVVVLKPFLTDLVARSVLSVSPSDC
ncbi:MAG: radical SAM family heme chaperone HemW [Actinomycetota bacterium]|nr:radical SAM family heme chaperone HemW [Actinomycetota bacterium]